MLALAAMLGGAFAVVPAAGDIVAKAKKAKFAKNAGKLDGLDSTAFLLAGATAANANSVGGQRIEAFRHEATAGNTQASLTILDHPMLNGNPGAFVFVIHIQTPGNYLTKDVGVFYDDQPPFNQAAQDHWTIYIEDSTSMTLGTSFHVLVVDPA